MEPTLLGEELPAEGTSTFPATNEGPFEGFGPDRWLPYPQPPLWRGRGDSPETLRHWVRSEAPQRPAVYGMLDVAGRLIYVGKSKRVRSRLLSYFLPGNEEEKAGKIRRNAVEIVIEPQPSEFAALLREQDLIRRFEPRWNVQGMPKRQRPMFLCLGRGPAATLYVSRQPDAQAIHWAGPFWGASRLRRVAEVLQRSFRLRDCNQKTPIDFSGQLVLFEQARAGCLRREIGTCLAPCTQGCTRQAYQRQVDDCIRFLEGEGEEVIAQLQQKMVVASQRLLFEDAMRLREDWRRLQWLRERIVRQHAARKLYHGLYALPGHDQLGIAYQIDRGQVIAAHRLPQSRSGLRQLVGRLSEGLGLPTKSARVASGEQSEQLALVAAWFRKYPQERRRLMPPENTSATD
ncbi:MAG: GIY-YIG nuclease family protein [Pirellulaceae bacterium]